MSLQTSSFVETHRSVEQPELQGLAEIVTHRPVLDHLAVLEPPDVDLLEPVRILIDFVGERTLAGDPAPEIRRKLRARARRAFALLEDGLADYAVKP